MRLPFPTRISVQKTLIFAAAVFVVQIVQQTDPIFALLFFVYILLSVLAFNLAGGFSRASGFYVFWFALLTCIVGGLWKMVLGEPASSNLVSPVATLLTYVLSMVMIMLALVVSRRITRSGRGLAGVLHGDEVNLGLASLGCLLANEATVYANVYLPHGNGTLVAIINQENVFLPFGILLGTVHVIRTSRGTRSVNVVTLLSAMLIFVFGGLIYYSKQGMFTPIVCWGAAAASQRYRLRPWQLAMLLSFAVYSVTILSPLSQVGRAIVPDDATTGQRAQLTADLLTHPSRLRADYRLGTDSPDAGERVAGFARSYYNSPQGLMDRLTIIQADDRLVTYTLAGHTEGYAPFAYYFINWIPHLVLKDKEKYAPPGATNPGNYYAHETGGLLSPDDYSTGISFSPTAEAFHLGGWVGVLTVAPFVWILLFAIMDLICGDLRRSPFGLIAAVYFAHVAPESLIAGLVQFIWTGSIAIIIAIVFCTYFAPILGTLLAGPQDPRMVAGPAPRLRPSEA